MNISQTWANDKVSQNNSRKYTISYVVGTKLWK